MIVVRWWWCDDSGVMVVVSWWWCDDCGGDGGGVMVVV